MAFSADMYHLIFLQKLWQQCADGVVDGNSTQASANDHNNRFGSGKTGEIETGQAVPLEQLPADGGSGEDSFVFRQIL